MRAYCVPGTLLYVFTSVFPSKPQSSRTRQFIITVPILQGHKSQEVTEPSPSPGQPGSTSGHPAVYLPPCSTACSLLGSCLESDETQHMEVCWVGEGQVLRVLSGGAGWVVGPGCQEDTWHLGVLWSGEHCSGQAGPTCRTSSLEHGPAARCLWIYVG